MLNLSTSVQGAIHEWLDFLGLKDVRLTITDIENLSFFDAAERQKCSILQHLYGYLHSRVPAFTNAKFVDNWLERHIVTQCLQSVGLY